MAFFRRSGPVTATLSLPVATSRLLVPVFVLLLIGAGAPVFSVQVPPLADYVNHLARMHVIAHHADDPLLGQFYSIVWAVIPNLIMDLLVPVLEQVMNVYQAGQVFVCLTLALLVTGSFAIHYALYRRWSPWPLVSFLFLYNNILLFGFMNYLFGLGVALWGVAAWIGLRRKTAWLRGGVSVAVILILFTCHLFAVGLYGLALACFEAWLLGTRRHVGGNWGEHGWDVWASGRTWNRQSWGNTGDRAISGRGRAGRWPSAADIAVFLVPFLPVLPLMWVSPTIGLATDISWESSGKVDGLYYIFQNYSDLFDLTLAALVVMAGIWAAQARLVALHPAGWLLLGAGAAVFMAMPRMFFSSWVADQRLPIALVFLLIGFVRLDDTNRAARYWLYVFVIGVAVARFVSVMVAWQTFDNAYADFRYSVSLIAPGSTILVANADNPTGSDAANMPLSHAACLAMIERSSLVTTAFSVPGKQVLSVRPAYRERADSQDGDPPTLSQLVAAASAEPENRPDAYWSRWTEQFNYVYVLYTGDTPNPVPDLLSPVFQGQRFQLYRVTPPKEDE